MDRDEFKVGNAFDVEVGWEGSGGEGVLELSDGSEGVRLDVVAVDTVEEEGVVIAYRPRIEGWFVEWRYNKLENQERSEDKEGEEAGGEELVREEKGNLNSLKITFLEVYKWFVFNSKHK